MHAMQLMHSPITYPQKYSEGHPHVELPEYFKEGKEKPPPDNNDMRLSAANGMRFVVAVFYETMQAIKDAGQWENTIVLFTSDNGGAIFPLSINNNVSRPLQCLHYHFFHTLTLHFLQYPLRG